MSIGLEGEGFRVALAEDGPAALLAFSAQAPDLVLLDVMLPGLDGLAVCRELRKVSLAPVIMLTARASTTDVIEGLESGADDYVTKPFDFSELVARIRSVLRRAAAVEACGDRAGNRGRAAIVLGPLTIDSTAHAVRRGSEEVPLTVTEFRLVVRACPACGTACSAASSCWSSSGAIRIWATAVWWTCTCSGCGRRSKKTRRIPALISHRARRRLPRRAADLAVTEAGQVPR